MKNKEIKSSNNQVTINHDTFESVKKEMETAKEKLKFAKNMMVIIEAFQNKNTYQYVSFAGTEYERTEKIFNEREEKLLYHARLTIKYRSVKHYDDMHKIEFGVMPTNTKKLRLALKHIEDKLNNPKIDWERSLMCDMIKQTK